MSQKLQADGCNHATGRDIVAGTITHNYVQGNAMPKSDVYVRPTERPCGTQIALARALSYHLLVPLDVLLAVRLVRLRLQRA